MNGHARASPAGEKKKRWTESKASRKQQSTMGEREKEGRKKGRKEKCLIWRREDSLHFGRPASQPHGKRPEPPSERACVSRETNWRATVHFSQFRKLVGSSWCQTKAGLALTSHPYFDRCLRRDEAVIRRVFRCKSEAENSFCSREKKEKKVRKSVVKSIIHRCRVSDTHWGYSFLSDLQGGKRRKEYITSKNE